MKIIDTHTHVFGPQFIEDYAAVLDRARKAGVEYVLLPNIDGSSVQDILYILDKEPMAKPMWGLHPCHVLDNWKEELNTIQSFLTQFPPVAIGEIGLDFYWSTQFKTEQIEALQIQLQWAMDMGLPVSLHTRNATQETIEEVKPFADLGLRGVFHCFSGTESEARTVVEMGFFLGIGGTITYKKSEVKSYLSNFSLGNILLETDAPYLSPVPHRGKRNEPSYLIDVVYSLSDIFKLSPQEIAETTSDNARKLFNL
jgi:TatD DNase family protein